MNGYDHEISYILKKMIGRGSFYELDHLILTTYPEFPPIYNLVLRAPMLLKPFSCEPLDLVWLTWILAL